MRIRRPSPEHEQAVARRLATLNAQWDAARAGEGERHDGLPAAERAPSERRQQRQEWPEQLWDDHTQVRGALPPVTDAAFDLTPAPTPPSGRPDGGDAPGPGVSPVAVPVPGRHAARRPMSGLRLPELPVQRVGLRGVHLVWVGLFAAVVLSASAWWVLQSRDVEMVVPVSASRDAAAPDVVPASDALVTPTTGAAAPSASPAPAGEVVVDVAGKVRRPGIVVLPVGARVVDAVEAAGGPRRGVDLQSLNLARPLVDGEQIVVGAPAAPVPGAAGPPAPQGASPAALVNLNTAAPSELESLPGVGPVTAAAIVEWRTRHGGFSSVEDLLEVHGIGEVTLERLAALVTV